MIEARRLGVIVLAAGASSRFGSSKLLAPLDGRAVLQWVLDTIAGLGCREVIVVVGNHADEVHGGIAWRDERIVRNPSPDEGLSSSLRLGIANLSPEVDAALVTLGDQPLVRATVIERLMARLDPAGPPIVAPTYVDGGRNPLLIHRSGWALVASATGDRGLGPLVAARPELVVEVPVDGTNPDVDTPGDLAAIQESSRSRDSS